MLTAAAVLLGGGCSVYDKDTCPEGGSYGKVVMDIVVPSSSLPTKVVTKADGDTWGDDYSPYENGDKYDNFIDLNTLQILFYRTVGSGEESSLQYVAALQNYDVVPVARTEDDKYEKEFAYRVIGELTAAERQPQPQKLTPGEYKVVVLANCPEASTSDLAALQVLDFFDKDKNQYIPMFGIATKTFSFVNGEVDDIGKVKLLRSTAKLEMMYNWNPEFRDSHKEIFDAVADGTIEGIKFKSIEFLRGVKAVNCLPTVALAGINDTEEALQEGCYNPAFVTTVNYFSDDDAKKFALSTDGTKGSIIVPEYTVGTQPVEETDSNKGTDATSTASTAVFRLVIEEPYKDGDKWKTRDLEFYLDPTITITGPNGPAAFVRNHLYRFKIVYYNGGKLFVEPTVADWINADELSYTINMSTNMRLFDSWLYRYDTDNNLTKDNYSDWATSHMVVSDGFVTATSDAEPVAGRPLRSPQIQLRTTGTGTFELTVDNTTNFELVKAVKNNIGVVTEYAHGSTISIAAGENVVTYFHIVPKAGVTWNDTNKEAKVMLFYDDPVTGRQKVPFNYNSLPGYSDDSSEIWVWYFPEYEYNNTNGDKLKMYFQDYNHPLVPTEDQS